MNGYKLTPVTHVIFDMDGLLLDTESRYEIAIGAVTKKYGKEYPFELKLKVMGRTGQESAVLICNELNLPITPQQYMQDLDIEYTKVFNDCAFMPGAKELVLHLHKNKIPIAIATSSKRHTYEMKTKPHKDLFNTNIFSHILICSDDPDVTRGKPDPQSYLVCASRFANKPQTMKNVLVFEDAPAGVQAGMSSGAQVVWVPDKRLSRSLAKATMTLNSLKEFRPEIFGLPKF